MLLALPCPVSQVADLEFVADFKVVATRAGKCDALLTWFDAIFRYKCDQEVVFTTGPQVMTLSHTWFSPLMLASSPEARQAARRTRGT